MKLRRLSYKDPSWTLEEITFNDVNLVVGKNAVGKSRTVEVLCNLIMIVLQKRLLDDVAYELSFEHEGKALAYSFRYEDGEIVYEQLLFEGECCLQRDKNNTLLKKERINPPHDKLTLHVRRDIVEYPFFELLIQWAQGFCSLFFNKEGENFLRFCKVSVPEMFTWLSPASREGLVKYLNLLNFPVKEIEAVQLGTTGEQTLTIKEANVEKSVKLWHLSLGMQRTLGLLVFMEYLVTKKPPVTLVIDDFCEGLDYDRSIKLGKLVFDFCLTRHIQLIVTSNDSILMDGIDLRYWNILRREGSVVSAVSRETHPRLFDDFVFTGLSNFDFFSSDYISRHNL